MHVEGPTWFTVNLGFTTHANHGLAVRGGEKLVILDACQKLARQENGTAHSGSTSGALQRAHAAKTRNLACGAGGGVRCWRFEAGRGRPPGHPWGCGRSRVATWLNAVRKAISEVAREFPGKLITKPRKLFPNNSNPTHMTGGH